MILLQVLGGSILGYIVGLGIVFGVGKIFKKDNAILGAVLGIIASVALWISLSKVLPNAFCYSAVFASIAACIFGVGG